MEYVDRQPVAAIFLVHELHGFGLEMHILRDPRWRSSGLQSGNDVLPYLR